MNLQKTSKAVHLASAVWFVACVIYILLQALSDEGYRWWVIFSLSGYSALLLFFLVVIYLFAVFKNVDRSNKLSVEHPITTTGYYKVFYDIAPFLGGLAGCMAIISINKLSDFLIPIALGTFAMTFFSWIFIDPVIAYIERLSPKSRRHRLERIAQSRLLRKQKQEEQGRLLNEILYQNLQESLKLKQVLQPYAEKLAEFQSKQDIGMKVAEGEIMEIGLKAWQLGGLNCMEELHSMAIEVYRQKCEKPESNDLISIWWDGIGSWRNPSLC